MVVTPDTLPQKVFPLPGYVGPIVSHGGYIGGSDIMLTPGSKQPVVSMVSGTVQFLSTEKTAPDSGGNAVTIHGVDGLDYYYAHLASPIPFAKGATVKAGQMLGIADSTGNAKNSPLHLHIGIGPSISTGVGAPGGVGVGFDAVSFLKSLVSNPRANNPDIATEASQRALFGTPGAGGVPLPPPTSSPVSSSLEDRIKWLASLLKNAGVDPSKIPTLVAISLAENPSSDPNVVSPTNDVGLWQINIPSWAQKLGFSATDLKDPIKNAQGVAKLVGAFALPFTQWCTYPGGCNGAGNPTRYNAVKDKVAAVLSGVDLGGANPVPGGSGDTNSGECPPMDFGPFKVPNLGCLLAKGISDAITQWKKRWLDWWAEWTHAHIANWGFVLVGFVILVVSIYQLISGNKVVNSAAGAAAKASMGAE